MNEHVVSPYVMLPVCARGDSYDEELNIVTKLTACDATCKAAVDAVMDECVGSVCEICDYNDWESMVAAAEDACGAGFTKRRRRLLAAGTMSIYALLFTPPLGCFIS